MKELVDKILNSNTITLIAHNNPDGDAVGSMFALKEGLEQLNKKVYVITQHNLPVKFGKLVRQTYVQLPEKQTDMLIILDCSEKERFYEPVLSYSNYIAVLDHHINSTPDFKYNYINIKKVNAATILVYELLKELNVNITPYMATLMYFGIRSDTLNLTTNTTTYEDFYIMGELVKHGADITLVNQVYNQTIEQFKLLSYALQRTQTDFDNKIMYSIIRIKDIKKSNSHYSDTKQVLEYLQKVDGIDVVLLLVENSTEVRVSARSKEFDVCKLMNCFNGGGHKNASGCLLQGNIYDIAKQIYEKYIQIKDS